jgi:hypothetical protein
VNRGKTDVSSRQGSTRRRHFSVVSSAVWTARVLRPSQKLAGDRLQHRVSYRHIFLIVQRLETRMWLHPGPHMDGEIAVVGHTVQTIGQILDMPHFTCIDTDCATAGCLQRSTLSLASGGLSRVNIALFEFKVLRATTYMRAAKSQSPQSQA